VPRFPAARRRHAAFSRRTRTSCGKYGAGAAINTEEPHARVIRWRRRRVYLMRPCRASGTSQAGRVLPSLAARYRGRPPRAWPWAVGPNCRFLSGFTSLRGLMLATLALVHLVARDRGLIRPRFDTRFPLSERGFIRCPSAAGRAVTPPSASWPRLPGRAAGSDSFPAAASQAAGRPALAISEWAVVEDGRGSAAKYSGHRTWTGPSPGCRPPSIAANPAVGRPGRRSRVRNGAQPQPQPARPSESRADLPGGQ
jgi:hypothetical protein